MIHALIHLAVDPEAMEVPGPNRWGHAMYIYRSKSFDTIVRFLAGFLRDEESSFTYASQLPAVGPCPDDSDLSTPQSEPHATPSRQAKAKVYINVPPEIFSDYPPTVSTVNETQVSKPASVSNDFRKRKRSPTPLTANDNEDEDEARPTKKIRFADDIFEPRAASLSRRPISPGARRVRKGQPPLIP